MLLNWVLNSYPENKFDIKEKVVSALNTSKEDSIFSLEDEGYILIDNEDALVSYFIIYFDNPEIELEAIVNRTLKPIAKVFMFMEIKLNSEKRFLYLRFILRDILAYRNRIMRMLESDFAGDMFTKYAHTIGEKNIIAHEKAISHNNTFDNESVLNFLVKQNMVNKYDSLDSNQSIKWLLMRNYVNEQIAKLFNRSFQSEEDIPKPSMPEIPVLYINSQLQEYNKVSFFNSKLMSFFDLNLDKDERFNLLESIIVMKYNNLKDYHFIQNEDEQGYNVEFMKCIFIDIVFSAIKYEVNKHEFLLRIDFLLNHKKRFRNIGLLPDTNILKELKIRDYVIEFMVENVENEKFQYLVIKNPVYKSLNDWKYKNNEIRKRMEDPLDYPDGHLSLLTIKRYIEGLRSDLIGKTEFQYYKENNQLWFCSKLPIIRKEI